MTTKILTTFLIAALFLAASCNSNHKNEKQSAENAATTNLADSLIQSTGDIELDSLLRVAAVAKKDSNLVFTYLDIGDAYIKNDSKTAAKYYFKAKELSKEINYKRGYILFAYHYAKILNEEGKSDSSLLLNKEALAMSIKSGNPVDIGRSYVHLGRYFWFNNMYDSAIVYLNNAKKYSAYNPANATNIKWLTFLVYNDLKRYDEARQIGEEVLSSRREANDLENVGITAFNLGITYRELGNKDRSLQLLEEALEISDKTHYNSLRMSTLITLTNAYELDDPKVKVYAEEALALAKKINSPVNEANAWSVLSTYHLLNKDFQKSLACADSSLVICNQKNFLTEKAKALNDKAYVFLALGKMKEAYTALNESDDVENKRVGDETQERIVLAEKKYETEKKNLEIENQKHIIKSQNLQRGLLVGSVAVLIVFLFLLWYMLRLRNRHNRTLSESNDILAEMNATKDKFFTIISHDLKNPAVAQRDALQILIDNFQTWDVNTITDYFEELLKSSEGHVEFILHLLEWAKVQTERMTYNPEQFYLSARLRPDIALIRNNAAAKGVELIDNIPDDVLVTADSNMISTVVRNLLTNAVKFTPKGGTVTLTCRCVARNTPTAQYTISVTDTGIGMNEEQIKNLFKLDNRHSRLGTADEQGSGLGLIVCKELLEKHGSELHIESTEGKGSRFEFTISAFAT